MFECVVIHHLGLNIAPRKTWVSTKERYMSQRHLTRCHWCNIEVVRRKERLYKGFQGSITFNSVSDRLRNHYSNWCSVGGVVPSVRFQSQVASEYLSFQRFQILGGLTLLKDLEEVQDEGQGLCRFIGTQSVPPTSTHHPSLLS